MYLTKKYITLLQPLNSNLEKIKRFGWPRQCEQATKIASVECLVSFERDLLLVLATDASVMGISGFLSHEKLHIHNTHDMAKRPITFISRSLTLVGKIYALLDIGLNCLMLFSKLYRYLIIGRLSDE